MLGMIILVILLLMLIEKTREMFYFGIMLFFDYLVEIAMIVMIIYILCMLKNWLFPSRAPSGRWKHYRERCWRLFNR